VLTGVETRTFLDGAHPARRRFSKPNTQGLYPAGEGAGLAGGILSAAWTELGVAEAVGEEYRTRKVGDAPRADHLKSFRRQEPETNAVRGLRLHATNRPAARHHVADDAPSFMSPAHQVATRKGFA